MCFLYLYLFIFAFCIYPLQLDFASEFVYLIFWSGCSTKEKETREKAHTIQPPFLCVFLILTCVPTDTLTLKSLLSQKGGWKSKKILTSGTVESPLYIDNGGAWSLSGTHKARRLQIRVNRNRQVSFARAMKRDDIVPFERISVASSTPLARRGYVASNLPKCWI